MIHIITLPPSRWQAYRDLRLHALQDSPQAFGRSYAEEAQRSDASWIQLLSETVITPCSRWLLFAETKASLCGMVGAVRETSEYVQHIAYVNQVYVDPACRGEGVGRLLLEALLEKLQTERGLTQLLLWVNTQEHAAIALYKKMGFATIGTLERGQQIEGTYYPNHLMEKSL